MTYFEVDDDVVLAGHVVGNVVIHNETQQTVQQSQVHLLVHAIEMGLHEHIALAIRCVPYILIRENEQKGVFVNH